MRDNTSTAARRPLNNCPVSPAQIEQLEVRQLLSASLASGVLTVNGTAGDDDFTLGSSGGIINVVDNGVTRSFFAAAVSSIRVNCFGGNDHVTSSVSILTRMYGGSGNDTLSGGFGVDSLFGEDGEDKLYGNGGDDVLYGGAGNDTCYAGSGDDLIFGGDNDDLLCGQGDNDDIYGNAGLDTLGGGSGADFLSGDADDDSLLGSSGDDHMVGGDGNDTLDGGIGNDYMTGDDGDDLFMAQDGERDTLFGGAGQDQAYVDAGSTDDVCWDIENQIPSTWAEGGFDYDGHVDPGRFS